MRLTTPTIIALCLLPSCASNDDSLAYLNQAQVEMMAQIDRDRVMAIPSSLRAGRTRSGTSRRRSKQTLSFAVGTGI